MKLERYEHIESTLEALRQYWPDFDIIWAQKKDVMLGIPGCIVVEDEWYESAARDIGHRSLYLGNGLWALVPRTLVDVFLTYKEKPFADASFQTVKVLENFLQSKSYQDYLAPRLNPTYLSSGADAVFFKNLTLSKQEKNE